jgi:hypothetical protein
MQDINKIKEVVAEQADFETGVFFDAETASEAHLLQEIKRLHKIIEDEFGDCKDTAAVAFADMPEMTREEQFAIRQWLALGHQENKCHIYGDDGELQCNNMQRHGRCLDFKREKISDLMLILQATILLESGKIKGMTRDAKPTDIVEMWGKVKK